MHDNGASGFKTGWVVGGVLAVLTIVEYYFAKAYLGLGPMTIIAVAKAWLIVQYFMHLKDLWGEGGHH